MPKLKYLSMCIKESMRLHCPVPFIERQTTKDMVIDGVTLPPGSILDVQIYNLHHNPTVWDEPMVSDAQGHLCTLWSLYRRPPYDVIHLGVIHTPNLRV